MTKKFTVDYVVDRIEALDPIRRDNWRHGTRDTYVFQDEAGAHWMVTIDVHHSEGWEFYGDSIDAVEVLPVEKTITDWVRR